MANENLDKWRYNPAIINETVAVTKEFLNNNLNKSNNIKQFEQKVFIFKGLFKGEAGFQECKRLKTVGGGIILKFLGGNWKEN